MLRDVQWMMGDGAFLKPFSGFEFFCFHALSTPTVI